MIRTITVQQRVSYTPVADELRKEVDILNEQNCRIINIFETKVNKVPGHSDQGFIIVYSFDEYDSSKPVMDCGNMLQQISPLIDSIKTKMNALDSESDTYISLKEISDKLKTIINGG